METKINLSQIVIQNKRKKSKVLLLKKFNSYMLNNALIKSEVKDSFNSPEKFFDPNSRVFVNRKINLKKIFPLGNIKQNINDTNGIGEPIGSSINIHSKIIIIK